MLNRVIMTFTGQRLLFQLLNKQVCIFVGVEVGCFLKLWFGLQGLLWDSPHSQFGSNWVTLGWVFTVGSGFITPIMTSVKSHQGRG